jgi:hypothetical protein
MMHKSQLARIIRESADPSSRLDRWLHPTEAAAQDASTRSVAYSPPVLSTTGRRAGCHDPSSKTRENVRRGRQTWSAPCS